MAKNLGKVGFALKGEWSAVVTYDQLEVVFYEGKVYAAKRSSTNAQPDSSPADWMMWAGSPVITSSAITGGHAVTITNADGTSETINVLDGEVTNAVLSETLNELIGNLSNLTTTNKSNVVAAINELDSDVDELQEGMETKAEIDGYYEDLTAGSAEQLISSVAISDNAPYNFRTSGGSIDIGDREMDKLVGGTVAWNQLYKDGNFPDGTTNWITESNASGTISMSVSNNIMSVTIVNPPTNFYNMGIKQKDVLNFVSNHKYLFTIDAKLPHAGSLVLRSPNLIGGGGQISIVSNASANVWKTGVRIVSANTNIFTRPYYAPNDVVGYVANDVIQYKNAMCIDLTAMFGSTIADYLYTLEQANIGDGGAWFKKLFPKPYYAYNAGELMSVNTSAHQMTGFNLCPFDLAKGEPASAFDATKCVRVIKGQTYELSHGNVTNATTWRNAFSCFDLDGNRIYTGSDITAVSGALSGNLSGQYYVDVQNSTYKSERFTTNFDGYIQPFILLGDIADDSVAEDTCIHYVWDGERNGEYEEYKLRSYPLDSSLTLRGIPKLDANNNLYYDGDTYESDGTVTRRYGIVDLGTLTWYRDGTRLGVFYTSGISNLINQTSYNGLLCPKYLTRNIGVPSADNLQTYDKRISIYPSYGPGYVYIVDTDYAGQVGSDFKTAMSGVYLVYELATPTIESADPYTNPQIVNDWGTEEYVDSRTVPIPVGHETLYQANLKAKLEMAPNSPDGDGDYIVRQTGGINEYVPLVIPNELPTMPSEDGTYTLKVTVASGVSTLTWEAEA